MQQPGDYGATQVAKNADASDTADAVDVDRRRVIAFACLLCLILVSEGYDIGVLNGAVVLMQEDLGFSTLDISMVVTATPLFVMPGSLVGGAFADAFGRRFALGVCCLLLVLGPLGMALSVSVGLMLAFRALVGFAIGVSFVVVSLFIAEVAPTDMRGRLTALNEVFLTFGILFGYAANWLLLGIPNDWRWMLGLGSLLPLFMLLTVSMPQFPESPRWLFKKGRADEAERVLTMFVGKEEAHRDIKSMSAQLDSASSTDEEFVTWHQIFCSWHDPKVRRMFLAGVTVVCGQMLCGYLAMTYYSSTVLKHTMSERAAFMATTVMGVVKLLVLVLALVILDRVGRRPMLLTSSCICGLACVWLAIAFTADFGDVMQGFGFSLFMAGFSLGIGPLTFVYASEVFATRWRAKGIAVSVFVSRIFGVISTYVFPLLLQRIGLSKTFWFMSALNVLVAGLLWAFVYETHGKSLEELERLFEDSPEKSA